VVLRPHIIYYLYTYVCMCVCVFVCFIYFLCIYSVTMWVPTTVIGHTKLTLEHVSFFPYIIPISSLTTYIITWYILHTYICIFFFNILHSIRIYYSHLACHASKQIMTKILYNRSFPHYIKRRFVVFCIHIILFVRKNFNTVYKSFLAASLWRMDQEYNIIIIILCLLKSIHGYPF